ncbi:MAG TPA: fibronectin type III domain-containing protein [bacterium]|nr:fibronectin type III domain-containing protein [bacterium]
MSDAANIVIDVVAPNPPINVMATENPDGTVALAWTPPMTNEDGSPISDLLGYNIYMVAEQNRCEAVWPVDGDATPLVCERTRTDAGGAALFAIDGPALFFDGADYNTTPFGSSAVWLDINNQDNPVTPLPLTDSADIDPSKPIFAFLLQFNLTTRSGETLGEYRITAFTQNSWSEIEQFLTRAAEFCALTPDSRITAHAPACKPSSTGGYSISSPPLQGIPSFECVELNPTIITDSQFIYVPQDLPQKHLLAAISVDESKNESVLSNILFTSR